MHPTLRAPLHRSSHSCGNKLRLQNKRRKKLTIPERGTEKTMRLSNLKDKSAVLIAFYVVFEGAQAGWISRAELSNPKLLRKSHPKNNYAIAFPGNSLGNRRK
jgi:hypothetical protein